MSVGVGSVSSGASLSVGSTLTLTASVTFGATTLTSGQVKFCDASATLCTDIHLLGVSQLTSAGTAVIRVHPATGNHTYKAIFLGTPRAATAYDTSTSAVSSISVPGPTNLKSTTTAISETGQPGLYALSATVTGVAARPPVTGTISFQDSSNANNQLAIATLAGNAPAMNWLNLPSSLAVTNVPVGIAKADFNGDGNTDVAITVDQGNLVAVFLSNGDGTFTKSTLTLPTQGGGLSGIVAADFNGDGKPDLAVVDQKFNLQGVFILTGNGDGTFATGALISVAGDLTKITTADFNGDGLADLALAIPSTYLSVVNPQSITVLLGRGDGTFTQSSIAMAANQFPQDLLAGDFTGDGQPDLVVLNSNAVGIMKGNGDGTFTAFSPIVTTQQYSYAEAADLNNDGKLDLIVLSPQSGALSILMGQGDGTFSLSPANLPNFSFYFRAHIGDFNGDGIADFLVIPRGLLYIGVGDGTFVSAPVNPSPTDTYGPMAVADFNSDGNSDAFGATGPGWGLSTLISQPLLTSTVNVSGINPGAVGTHLIKASYSGSASYAASLSAPVVTWGPQPATTTTLTVNAGGSAVTTVNAGIAVTLNATVKVGANPIAAGVVSFCDAAATTCSDIYLLGTAVVTSNGTASFKFVPAAGQHSYRAVFLPNGNGLSSTSAASPLTVAASPFVAPTVTTLVQTGTVGNYTLTATVTETGATIAPTGLVSFVDTSYSNKPLATAALGPATRGVSMTSSYQYAFSGSVIMTPGDFNGDGIPDVATIGTPSTDLSTPATGVLSVLLGKGDGTFTAVKGPTYTGSITNLVAGDFNADGKIDLAFSLFAYVGQQGQNSITVLLGNGDGTFTALPNPLIINLNAGYALTTRIFTIGDYNGDGKLDLLTTDGVNTTSIFLGNGDGTFVAKASGIAYGTLAVADLNADGTPDVITNVNSNSFVAYLGNADGTFTQAGSIVSVGIFFGYATIADFNKDGIPDVATVPSSHNGPVQIYLGKGDGTFPALKASMSVATDVPSAILAADFNSDGNVDLIVSNGNSYSNIQNPAFVVLLGNGDGTFQSLPVNVPIGNIGAIITADFNGDSKPDIVAQTFQGASVLLVQPTQTATATASGVSPAGPAPHLVAASYPGDTNNGSSLSGTAALSVKVAAPAFSPAPGTYSSLAAITLTEATPGAAIYYNASGSVQTNGYVLYTGPIPVYSNGSANITIYGAESGYLQSDTVTGSFAFSQPAAPPPVISLAPGYYPGTQTITITDSVPGATIFYTINGGIPSPYTTTYVGPITVSATETIAAIASGGGYSPSPVTTAQYYIGSSSASFIYNVAGSAYWWGYEGDGRPATEATLSSPMATAVDVNGNVYIADAGNSVVRRVDAKTGIIATFAGTGVSGYAGDGGLASAAQLRSPVSVALDRAGNLFICDSGFVRRVAADTGIITTYAGSSTATVLGDNGPATNALLAGAAGLAFDSAGNLYIATFARVRKVNAVTGIITTVAGSGSFGIFGDQGPATNAALEQPQGIAIDGDGSLYIADSAGSVVRKVNGSTGIITTIAGGVSGNSSFPAPNPGYSGDGGPAVRAALNGPVGIALDVAGNIYIADKVNNLVRKITAATGTINTVVGIAYQSVIYSGDGGTAIGGVLSAPNGLTFDAAGSLYISESGSSRVRKVTPNVLTPSTPTAPPTFSLPTGTYASAQTVTVSDSTPGAAIYLVVNGTTAGTSGGTYHGPINVTGTATLQAIAVAPGFLPSAPATITYTITTPPSVLINTIAGNGGSNISVAGKAALGGPATAIEMAPYGAAIDASGNIYVADPFNYVVWKIDSSKKNASVVVGTLGVAGFPVTGVPATQSNLFYPIRVVLDAAGNLYVSETSYGVVLKVSAQTGVISTYAGGGFNTIPYGDGGPATAASLSSPQGLAFDSAGNLYIADTGHRIIRMVSAKTGVITTVAGTYSTSASTGLNDGNLATTAVLSRPQDIAIDKSGNLYIAEVGQLRVRLVASATGLISTVAGNGIRGASGDGGKATAARIYPQGMVLDGSGDLYISNGPNIVRKITAADGIITTVAGSGYTGFGGDGGSPTVAELSFPNGLAVDSSGNLYIADSGNFRLRQLAYSKPAPAPVFSVTAGSYPNAQTVTITDTIQGAAIYYTVDGTDPTTSSTTYNGPITVASSATLKAIATAKGYLASTITSATYTINNPVPVLNSLSPAYVSAGSPAFSVKLSGSGFTSGSTVYWGTNAIPTQLGSATSLTAQVPASALTAAGISTVTVATPSPGGGVSNALQFEVDTASGGAAPPVFSTPVSTVVRGATATYPVTLPSSATNVSVACLNLPAGATCSYSTITNSLSISTASTTPAGTYSVTVAFTETLPGAAAAALFLPILMLPWAVSKRKYITKRILSLLLLAVSFSMLTSMVGCSGSGAGSTATTTPPVAQTHQITSSAVITLTVQ